jgi:hypothetical protein
MSLTTITKLNDIVKLFKDFANNHPQLNDFGWGMTYDIGTSYKMNMPYCWLTHRASNRITPIGKSQTKYFNFTVLLMDKINIQQNIKKANGFESDNTADVLTRMDLIAHDLIAYLQHNLTMALIDGDVSLELAYDETDDKVAGWVLDIQIKQVYKNCINPI